MHGEQDKLQAPQNASLLADSIRGAELKLWPYAGHLYVTDEPEADRCVMRFLERHENTLTTKRKESECHAIRRSSRPKG